MATQLLTHKELIRQVDNDPNATDRERTLANALDEYVSKDKAYDTPARLYTDQAPLEM